MNYEIPSFVIPAKAGIQRLSKVFWIPAFAGMTEREAGMTEREAGMTEREAGMTEREAGMTEGIE